MAFNQKILGDGQLPNAEGNLYLVPAATKALVKTIIMVNITGGAITVNLMVKKSGGTSRRIWEKDYSIPMNEQRMLDANITLETGDAIRGYASAVTSIDYSIFGIEEA